MLTYVYRFFSASIQVSLLSNFEIKYVLVEFINNPNGHLALTGIGQKIFTEAFCMFWNEKHLIFFNTASWGKRDKLLFLLKLRA